jgi:hypothetical protein
MCACLILVVVSITPGGMMDFRLLLATMNWLTRYLRVHLYQKISVPESWKGCVLSDGGSRRFLEIEARFLSQFALYLCSMPRGRMGEWRYTPTLC